MGAIRSAGTQYSPIKLRTAIVRWPHQSVTFLVWAMLP